MTVRDGHIHLDLTGTDPQLEAPYNVPTGGVKSAYFTAKIMHLLRTYDGELPLNSGLLDNVTVEV
jgi:N-methylhydantoinase B